MPRAASTASRACPGASGRPGRRGRRIRLRPGPCRARARSCGSSRGGASDADQAEALVVLDLGLERREASGAEWSSLIRQIQLRVRLGADRVELAAKEGRVRVVGRHADRDQGLIGVCGVRGPGLGGQPLPWIQVDLAERVTGLAAAAQGGDELELGAGPAALSPAGQQPPEPAAKRVAVGSRAGSLSRRSRRAASSGRGPGGAGRQPGPRAARCAPARGSTSRGRRAPRRDPRAPVSGSRIRPPLSAGV